MASYMKHCILISLLLITGMLEAQIIFGSVFDNHSKTPLDGATVYLDGTNIGTITNPEGQFHLDISDAPNALIVIRFIGYKTRTFRAQELKTLKDIYLDENPNRLDEVLVEADTWSRAKKLNIFKSEFLGKTKASKYCKIKNEDDIYLKYTPSTQTLVAYADVPIMVENKYLGYTVEYNMVDFEVTFNLTMQGLRYTHKVYSAGTSFFRELHKNPKKKHLENRRNTYHGSLIHFMRALKDQELTENKFVIYYKSFPAPPYKYFKHTPLETTVHIEMTSDNLSVLYDQAYQSSLEYNNGNKSFHIDHNGNHSPPNAILVGGDFGVKRFSNMLPLNYSPEQQ